jgi:hypothetical protein
MRDTLWLTGRRIFFSLIALLALLAFNSQCGEERLPSVTVTPDDGAVDQAVDVLVQVTFSRSVSDMGPWSNFFTLTKVGSIANLCTDYNVNTDRTNVQCVHDDLELDSSYLIVVQHPQTEGLSSTFTTVAN